jgi:hypothetical protein
VDTHRPAADDAASDRRTQLITAPTSTVNDVGVSDQMGASPQRSLREEIDS